MQTNLTVEPIYKHDVHLPFLQLQKDMSPPIAVTHPRLGKLFDPGSEVHPVRVVAPLEVALLLGM